MQQPLTSKADSPRFSGEWEVKRLADFASIRNHKVLPSNVPRDTPCVELEHIESGAGSLQECSTAQHSTSAKYCFCSGDVLFGRLRPYLRKYWHADRDGICTTEIWPLMVDPMQADSRFLYAIAQCDRFIETASISYGTHMPRADWGILRNFRVRLPKVAEQYAIGEVLSDVDGLLESLDSLIMKKRVIKHATMQRLLTGASRLPGFRGKWVTRRIGEISDIDPENLPSNTDRDFRFNYISLEQIETGTLLGFSEERFQTAPSRARRVLRYGDVLMSTVRPNLMAHFLYKCQVDNAICSTGFAVLRSKNKLCNPGFLYEHLFGHIVNRQIEQMLVGSNYPAINSYDVRRIKIPLAPTADEQAAIVSVLSDMDDEISALEKRRDKVRAIKEGMMQQLLTGRVRLPLPAESEDEELVP